MSFHLSVEPNDEHNQELVRQVHPADWVNPTPADRYNLVVIGAGTAGLVSAAGVGWLGGKVALIERGLLGGDCLNYGCVPSKALIRAARAISDARNASAFGAKISAPIEVDFPAVMERMRRLRAQISSHDSPARFRDEYNVDVFLGEAKFTGRTTVQVGEHELKFRKAILATGARAAEPTIPGLSEVGYLTNETVFSLTELPRRLAVIGAGPIGCELAHAFARFGSEVTLIGKHAQILPKEDADAAEIVQRAMASDGVKMVLGCDVQRVDAHENDKVLHVAGCAEPVHVDEILVGVGRAPNVEGLGLEEAGVKYDTKAGIDVDDRLKTTNGRIFAAGDCCSRFKFTHTADAMARIAVRNALFLGRSRVSALTIPWCTFTDPEIAHVGITEKDAKEQSDVDTLIERFADVDRAILDGETEGFVKVHVRKGKIVGATIVARHAGEMISELTLAMVAGTGLKTLAGTIHPYPTQAEAIKRIADAHNRTRLTPFVRKLFRWWLSWTR